MKEQILDFIKLTHPSFKEIQDHFNEDIIPSLNELEKDAQIEKVKDKYYLPSELNLIRGVVTSIKKTVTFVTINEDEDVAVDNASLAYALLGDTVLLKKTRIGKDEYFEVKRVTNHNLSTLVGVCLTSGLGKNKEHIFIPDKEVSPVLPFKVVGGINYKDKEVVEVQIQKYTKNFIAVEVIKVIGNPFDLGMDVTRIILSNNAPLEFPKEVEEEVKKIPTTLLKEEKVGREDFTSHTICTIDGDDAKDFDDAVEVIKEGELYHIGVHIADVAHYVKTNSPLDKEALNRSTSLYAQDRVVPMLPFELSNEMCSLKPNEERLVTSCLVTLDKQGKIVSSRITKGIIKSSARLTYNYVNALFANHQDYDKCSKLERMLLDLKEVSAIIRKKRQKAGALEIETNELKFEFNQKLEPINVIKKGHGVAEAMIEDLMILANEVVASTIEQKKVPMIYRVHTNPKAKKLEAFKRISASRYYLCDVDNLKCTPLDLAKYLSSITDEDDKKVLSSLLLRCLAKAKYSSKNEKHFGLASLSYTHFTSPIRRYPDLMVHRLIDKYLISKDLTFTKDDETNIDNICMLTSTRERRALTISRSVDSLLSAKYMKRFEGEIFKGKIVSMIVNGLFIELDNGIEGMLPFDAIGGDYYIFDEASYTAYGIRRGHHFNLGDELEVILVEANAEKSQITFALHDRIKVNKQRKPNGRRNKSYHQK